MSTEPMTVTGRELCSRDTVHIAWRPNEENRCVLTRDSWGDRAPIVDWQTCQTHEGCRVLTVAPDDTDTLEYPHAADNESYAVIRLLS